MLPAPRLPCPQLYVGNLVPGAVSDQMLMQLFNTALQVSFPGSAVPGACVGQVGQVCV